MKYRRKSTKKKKNIKKEIGMKIFVVAKYLKIKNTV